jgi:uncharacterized protein
MYRPDEASEVAVAAIVFVSALPSSIGGFAFSALAGAGLAHLAMEPVRAVRTMALCSLAIQLYAVWNIRAAVRWRGLWPMMTAGALGGIAGGLAGFPGLFVTIWCSMRGGDKLQQRAVLASCPLPCSAQSAVWHCFVA